MSRVIAHIKDLLFSRKNKIVLEEFTLDGIVVDITLSYVVTDIEDIPQSILANLKAGDTVLKQDATGKHTYLCSYKKDDEGLCLTYTDASVVETVSYDLVDSVWTFNSTERYFFTSI